MGWEAARRREGCLQRLTSRPRHRAPTRPDNQPPPPLTPSSSHGPHGCLPAMEAGAWRLQREAEQDGAK